MAHPLHLRLAAAEPTSTGVVMLTYDTVSVAGRAEGATT
jgi:hypothetical protein